MDYDCLVNGISKVRSYDTDWVHVLYLIGYPLTMEQSHEFRDKVWKYIIDTVTANPEVRRDIYQDFNKDMFDFDCYDDETQIGLIQDILNQLNKVEMEYWYVYLPGLNQLLISVLTPDQINGLISYLASNCHQL